MLLVMLVLGIVTSVCVGLSADCVDLNEPAGGQHQDVTSSPS